jgi:hypothetical protein
MSKEDKEIKDLIFEMNKILQTGEVKKMQKWKVTIYPHDYSVGKIEKVKADGTTEKPFYHTVTLSGVMIVEVEVDTEHPVVAGYEAVKQVLIKRVKDLEDTQKRERERNRIREDNTDAAIKKLLEDIRSFMEIIRGGELEVYDTGRRIFATWYHREPKRELRTELPSGILFDQLVNTIKDSVNLPEEDCY